MKRGTAGRPPTTDTGRAECPDCHGEGEVQFNPSWNNDPQSVESGRCPTCYGTGTVAADEAQT